jgi:hypothetical protein
MEKDVLHDSSLTGLLLPTRDSPGRFRGPPAMVAGFLQQGPNKVAATALFHSLLGQT